MDRVREFYEAQYTWAGWAAEWASTSLPEIATLAEPHVAAVERLAGSGPKRILEIGAGGGFTSAGLAMVGHQVTAVEIVDVCIASIRRLAAEVTSGSLRAVAGDMYDVDIEGSFDLVLYLAGFGIGADGDQRRLLRRIAEWLEPEGSALIDVFSPSYWVRLAGDVDEFPPGSGIRYEEGYDHEGSRMVETMRRDSEPEAALVQSLRCYSPVDLRLLLEGCGLSLVAVEPYEDQSHRTPAPMAAAMLYLAKLERTRSAGRALGGPAR